MKKVKEDKNNLLIKEIDDKADEIHAGLGITDKRADVLGNICTKVWKVEENFVICMEKISKECLHVNEVCFCTVVVMSLRHDHSQMQDPFLKFLGMVLRGKRDEDEE